MQYNYCAFCGYLGRDPEVRYTSGGKAVVKYSLAVSEKWTDRDGNKQESTAWIEGEVWGRSAENFGEYCSKGSNVFVQGKMKQESWEDKNTGKKRTKLVLNTKMWQVLNRDDDGDGRRGGRDSRDRQREEEPARADSGGNRDRHDDDDVPF